MISVITPTSDRGFAFALCEQWMKRQTIKPDEWIVVDSGHRPVITTLGQKHILTKQNLSPTIDFLLNVKTGLLQAKFDKILFIEDDDWYSPTYLEEMSALLDYHELVGQRPARYYHLHSGSFKIFPNDYHASLSQTGIKNSMVLQMLSHIHDLKKTCDKYLDMRLWIFGSNKKLVEKYSSVGIKGLVGKKGLGDGHNPNSMLYKDSIDKTTLKNWIGDDLAFYYSVNQ